MFDGYCVADQTRSLSKESKQAVQLKPDAVDSPLQRTDSRAEFERIKIFRHGPVRPGRSIPQPTSMDCHDRANGGEATSCWLEVALEFKEGALVNLQYPSGTMKSVPLRSCPNAGAAKIAGYAT